MYQKILHLIHTPRFSGAEILVRDLCLIHQKKGITSAIASFAPPEANYLETIDILENKGIRIYAPAQRLVRFERIRFYRKVLHDFKPEVVYAHSAIPAFYGRMAIPCRNRPFFFFSVLHATTDYKDIPSYLCEFLCARCGDGVFSVSPQGAENYRRKIPHHRPITVVPNGTNLSTIKHACSNRSALRKTFDLTESQKLIVQVGRLCNMKQQTLSFDATLPLLKKDINIVLWFAGISEDKEYEALLKEKIEGEGLQGRVKLLGGRKDIPDLLAAADVFLMPSLNESQGIAMIEALASGIAVVGSDIPAFKFASSMEGTTLVPAENVETYTQAIKDALEGTQRYRRDMSQYDMNVTASVYGDYADLNK